MPLPYFSSEILSMYARLSTFACFSAAFCRSSMASPQGVPGSHATTGTTPTLTSITARSVENAHSPIISFMCFPSCNVPGDRRGAHFKYLECVHLIALRACGALSSGRQPWMEGPPRTFVDTSSRRPHHDLDAGLYVNPVTSLYTSRGRSRK